VSFLPSGPSALTPYACSADTRCIADWRARGYAVPTTGCTEHTLKAPSRIRIAIESRVVHVTPGGAGCVGGQHRYVATHSSGQVLHALDLVGCGSAYGRIALQPVRPLPDAPSACPLYIPNQTGGRSSGVARAESDYIAGRQVELLKPLPRVLASLSANEAARTSAASAGAPSGRTEEQITKEANAKARLAIEEIYQDVHMGTNVRALAELRLGF
jgi:hypothetical protein